MLAEGSNARTFFVLFSSEASGLAGLARSFYVMDSAQEPIEQQSPVPAEPVAVNDSPVEPKAEVHSDGLISDAADLPPDETPVQGDEAPPEVLPEAVPEATEVVDAPVEKVEDSVVSTETTQSDTQSPTPPDSPMLDEKAEKRGKKTKEGKGKNKKKVEEEVENPNSVGQQVDFDGPRKDPRHSYDDMTSDDMKAALQFYGTLDREFLHDLLLKHFEDRELENLFYDMLDTEGEEVYSTSQYVKKGTLNFDDLNQRFIGVPAACASVYPKETFKTDRYPFKLAKKSSTHQRGEEPGQQEHTMEGSKLFEHHKITVQSSTTTPKYIRIGDVDECPPPLLKPQEPTSVLHRRPESPLVQKEEPEVETDAPLDSNVMPEIMAPKESFQVNSSLLIHPGAKTRFDRAEPRDKVEVQEEVEEGEEYTGGGDSGYLEEPKQAVMTGSYPEQSDFSIIYDYAQNYGKVIWADEISLYTTDHGRDTLRKMGPSAQKFPALEAVKIGKALLRNHVDHDLRYPIMTGSDRDSNIRHLIVIPLRDSDDVVKGVVEFARTWNFSAPFPEDLFIGTVEDITFFASMVWRGADCRREVNTYRVLGARFQELYIKPTNWDNVLYKFMVLIKSQLNADRVHLFRMNHHENIAVASVYDTGKLSKQGYHFDYSKEVTLPIGETFFRNIQYLDDYINVRQSSHAWIAQMGLDDKLPGPPVRNFLAMSFNEDWEGKVCEVLLLINSAGKGGFTKCEENVLRSLLSFFYSSMGTHYFRHRMSVTSRPFKVEEELFFKLCNENRADSAALWKLCDESYQPSEDFFTYDFHCTQYLVDDFALPRMLVFMLDTLFGPDGFHREKLMSFVIAVREGYRNIRYHTWSHGFHVAHCLFVILHTNSDFLTVLERKALIIAGVCHDLDHFGYNNSFTKRFSTAFDTLYTASCMEHHHIRETFRIMSSSENDILSGWSEEDKSKFALLVKHAILATDQITYFAEKNTLEDILHTKLDIDNPDHRQRVMNLMMSSSDLVVSGKPWEIHRDSTEDLYCEFHHQGDSERFYGDQPMPMMDRDNYPNMPKDQIGYLKHIVLPMFKLLAKAIPNTAAMVHGCVKNITAWEEEVVRREEEQLPPEDAETNEEVHPKDVRRSRPNNGKRGEGSGQSSSRGSEGEGRDTKRNAPSIGASMDNAREGSLR